MRTIPYICGITFAFVVALTLCMPVSSFAQVSVAVTIAPPELPVYEQPICPEEGYLWTPGYWAYDYDFGDYYWVPGTWVPAPEVGFLWTPGYWAWGGREFIFYEGYWSYQVVGFYGGINYGHGYFGRGFEGGHWDNRRFFYNRSVNNVDVTNIHNVYEAPVNIRNASRVSHNGGEGGVDARPTSQEEAAAHARHLPPVPAQTQHFQAARSNPQLRASVNHGKPPIAATPKAAAFNEHGVVPAREAGTVHGGPSNAGRGDAQPGNNKSSRATAVHPNELPPAEHPSPPNTGNPKQDQKYQKQQEKMYAQQEKERQELQQQQEQEHQQLAKQNADEASKRQVEQQHQQQTKQLRQKHAQQQQKLQEKTHPRSAPPPPPPPPPPAH